MADPINPLEEKKPPVLENDNPANRGDETEPESRGSEPEIRENPFETDAEAETSAGTTGESRGEAASERSVFGDLQRGFNSLFGGGENKEAATETSSDSSEQSSILGDAVRLVGKFTGSGINEKLDTLLAPEGASEEVAQLAAAAKKELVTGFVTGDKAEVLDDFLSSMETIREKHAAETDTDGADLLENHRELLESMIGFELAEDQKSLAGPAATLMLNAQDQEATETNERQDLIRDLMSVSDPDTPVKHGELLQKASESLSHLSQEEQAEVYSSLIEQAGTASGLFDQVDVSDLDLSTEEQAALKDATVKGFSSVLGDVFSRVEKEDQSAVFNAVGKLFDGKSPEQLQEFLDNPGALFSDPSSLGLSQEELDQAEIALTKAGLSYLQDTIGLSQGEVDDVSNLLRLSQSLAGEDGVFNEDDVASLAANLSINDIDALIDAKSQVQDRIMSNIAQQAFIEAERQIKSDPQFRDLPKLLAGPGQIAAGVRQYNAGRSQYNSGLARYNNAVSRPLVRLFGGRQLAQGRAKLAQGRSQLAAGEGQLWSGVTEYNTGVAQLNDGKARGRREATAAIEKLGVQMDDIFDSVARTGASIEVSRQLRQQLQDDPTKPLARPSQEDSDAAFDFFESFSTTPLSEVSDELLREAVGHHENLTIDSIERRLTAGINRDTQELSEGTKNSFRGVEKYLALQANRDIREGITQENLEAAQNSEATINALMDKFNKAYGLDIDGGDLIQQFRDGGLSLEDAKAAVAEQFSQTSRTVELAEQYFKKDINKDLFEMIESGDKSGAAEHLQEREIAAFEHNGKEYLGYTVKDSNGNKRLAFTDGKANRYMTDSSMRSLYQAALNGETSSRQTSADQQVATLAQDQETQRMIQDYVARGFIKPDEVNDPRANFAVFEHNGQKFLGMNDHKLLGRDRIAFINQSGTRVDFSAVPSKVAAYEAALSSQTSSSQRATEDSSGVQSGPQVAKLSFDESLLRDDGLSYSQEVASQVLGKESHKAFFAALEKQDHETAEKYLQDRNFSAFRYNGQDYIGYITSDGKLARQAVNDEGQTESKYIEHEGMKAAYYGALQRDGINADEIEAFDSVSGSEVNRSSQINTGPRSNYGQPSSGPGSFDSLPNMQAITLTKDGAGYFHASGQGQGGSSYSGSNSQSYGTVSRQVTTRRRRGGNRQFGRWRRK